MDLGVLYTHLSLNHSHSYIHEIYFPREAEIPGTKKTVPETWMDRIGCPQIDRNQGKRGEKNGYETRARSSRLLLNGGFTH